MFTATSAAPSKMSFIASMLTTEKSFWRCPIGRDRLDVVSIVVERVVEKDRLKGSRARAIIAREGVDVHPLDRVRDRVVVQVEVDRLSHQRAASRDGEIAVPRCAVMVRSS